MSWIKPSIEKYMKCKHKILESNNSEQDIREHEPCCPNCKLQLINAVEKLEVKREAQAIDAILGVLESDSKMLNENSIDISVASA